MEKNASSAYMPQIIVGILILAVGVLFLLENLDIMDAGGILRFWPLALIAYGLAKLMQPRDGGGHVWGAIVAVAGVAFLLHNLDLFDVRPLALWPLILVIVGGSLIWRSFGPRRAAAGAGDSGAEGGGENTLNGLAMLGGFKRSVASQDFRGGQLTAVMGGCEVDLRNAAIKGDAAVIDVFAFWGGIELRVPETWTVVLQATPILGGFDDKTRPPHDGTGKRLVVKGAAVMGGVEIKN